MQSRFHAIKLPRYINEQHRHKYMVCIYETLVSTNLWINPEAGPIQPNPEAMVFSSTLWAGGVNLATKKLTRTWDLTTYVPGPRSKAPDFETKIPRHLVLTTSGYLPTARFLVPCPRYLLPAAEGFAGRDLAGRLVSVEHQVGAEHPQIQLDQDQGSGSVLSGSTVIRIRIVIRTIPQRRCTHARTRCFTHGKVHAFIVSKCLNWLVLKNI